MFIQINTTDNLTKKDRHKMYIFGLTVTLNGIAGVLIILFGAGLLNGAIAFFGIAI